jgi:hypothetical protein
LAYGKLSAKGENPEEIKITAIFENILLKLSDRVFLSINQDEKRKKYFSGIKVKSKFSFVKANQSSFSPKKELTSLFPPKPFILKKLQKFSK